jgi:hypothetical protein
MTTITAKDQLQGLERRSRGDRFRRVPPECGRLGWEDAPSLGRRGVVRLHDAGLAGSVLELLSRALKQGERPSAVLIAAWSSGAAELMTTEGARRRMRVELERLPERDADQERADATVTAIRTRLEGR